MTTFSSLNPFDWLLLAILVYSTASAFVRGFFREVFSLVGLVAGILLASWNYQQVSVFLVKVMSWATAQVVAFLLIAIATMLLCGFAGSLLRRTAKTIGLGFLDRLLGAGFGLARGCLMGVALLMAAAAFLPQNRYIRGSQLSGYFLQGAHAISFVVPTNLQQQIRDGVHQLTRMT